MRLTQQQVDLFKHETQVAAEKIKDANWHFTKEICAELTAQTAPSQILNDLAEKFMLLLNQKDRSWSAFKVTPMQNILKNFGPLKALMNSISADHLSEEQLTGLLPVWKNQHVMQASLQKAGRGACVISEWISHCVEYKLKKETLNSAQRSLPDLESKTKKCMATIAEKTEESQQLDKDLELLRTRIETHSGPDSDERLSFADGSVNSLKSTMAVQRIEDLLPAEPYVRFVPHSPPSHKKAEFPNFYSDRLYEEAPPAEFKEDDFQVDTSESEYCRGCQSRFFCI